MDKQKVLAKIKKCLALAKSANEHEAAAALRQARKLMDEYQVSDAEVLAAGAHEADAKSGAKTSPAKWECWLASVVAEAFGCECIFVSTWAAGTWRFIGCDAAPEIASYAFSVLLRQAKAARADYAKTSLKRCKPAIRVARSDMFCQGWVGAVSRVVGRFAANDVPQEAIDAFKATHYPDLKSLKGRDRNAGQDRLRDHQYKDLIAGASAGQDAKLDRGVNGTSEPLAIAS